MRVSIDNLATGFAPDQADITLPDGVFTDSRNLRFRDGAAEKAKGTTAVFGSLSSTAIWISSVSDGINQFWTYGNESVLYGTDGSTHAQISTASYNATLDLGYTGGAFHGFMLLNDGVAVPQTWTPALANKVVDLVNWPASTYCRVIRSFNDFIIALRMTESSVYNPRVLRWSDIAGVGALPGSWDYTDPTNSAGRTELGQTQDELVDCLPLRGNNIVYKANSTWLMQPIGGLDVFQFSQLFGESGMLTEDCARAIESQHFVVTDSDIIIHDGASATSLIDKKLRRWLFNQLSQAQYKRSFVVADYKEREMWFCFPTTGDTFATLAVVWDWSQNTIHVRELGTTMAAGNSGIIGGAVLTWANASSTWSAIAQAWDEVNYSASARRVILTNASLKRAYQGNTGETFDGTAMTAYATRSNMGLTKDVGQINRVRRVFPKVYGTAGETFKVRVGGAATPDAAVSWSAYQTLTIGTDYKVDCRVSGRFIHLNFQYTGSNAFKAVGFDIEFDHDGLR